MAIHYLTQQSSGLMAASIFAERIASLHEKITSANFLIHLKKVVAQASDKLVS